ncbi:MULTISPECIES: hypothetical protein [unclassified Dietzia]|uniref:hypothetical protein n=1 Tax=unclassified Dietzia TaxID=2617939 RepID=UPI0015FE1BD0|nr:MULTISPECIES: hypothetical protein [unclassified Dietzia]MBB1026072.1 hypothetical protein [Dietzia sp. DQ12-76]MBB1029056.1 hypothetical protein [Dietzia sp. DQ11-38-2]
MKGRDFAKVLARLPPNPPITTAYEKNHRQGSPDPRTKYRNQRDHMVGWMSEIDGPGAYGRKTRGRDARAAYNSLRCAPALIWMAEALGEKPAVVKTAVAASDAAGPNFSAQCAAIRKVVTWSRIEELVGLQDREPSKFRLLGRRSQQE